MKLHCINEIIRRNMFLFIFRTHCICISITFFFLSPKLCVYWEKHKMFHPRSFVFEPSEKRVNNYYSNKLIKRIIKSRCCAVQRTIFLKRLNFNILSGKLYKHFYFSVNTEIFTNRAGFDEDI